jgi:hypothetical protein
MSNTLITILTDAGARSAASVKESLIRDAEIAGPWFNVQEA